MEQDKFFTGYFFVLCNNDYIANLTANKTMFASNHEISLALDKDSTVTAILRIKSTKNDYGTAKR